MHDSVASREAKLNFVEQFIQKIPVIQDFSGYNFINEKFRKLVSECQISSLFKNEEFIYSDVLDKRIILSKIPKSEIKKRSKLDRNKDIKPKKRSAQLAEISIM